MVDSGSLRKGVIDNVFQWCVAEFVEWGKKSVLLLAIKKEDQSEKVCQKGEDNGRN